ncbi:MAG TPA: PIN domain-containing protein [Silvibacterium sp.]|nr:PIN domain-containing protein [Silvibacterium sp.]
MSARFFLDTNVFVYSFDTVNSKKCREAEDLIAEAVKSRQGVVSYQVVQEFFHLALRRFASPMTVVEAEQYLDTVFRPLLTVHSSRVLYTQALHVQDRYRLAWYDSLIVASAIEAGCVILYSEDLQDGQRFDTLQVKNPFV